MPTCPPMRNGEHLVPWIVTLTGDCGYGVMQEVSVLFGLVSIGFWMVAQMPQLLLNYRRKSADGLSGVFLSIWLAGDLTNLVGCLMTHQLATQTFQAVYFVFIDSFLCAQWLYYVKGRELRQWYRERKARFSNDRDDEPLATEPIAWGGKRGLRAAAPRAGSKSSSTAGTTAPGFGSLAAGGAGAPVDAPTTPSSAKLAAGSVALRLATTQAVFTAAVAMAMLAAACLAAYSYHAAAAASAVSAMAVAADPQQQQQEISAAASLAAISVRSGSGGKHEHDHAAFGLFIGWVSALLYLASRSPQIVKNFRRKSAEGLAWGMFMCAVMGNLTYAVAIFTWGGEDGYLVHHLPWIVGSVGTLMFDATIFTQFWLYRDNKFTAEAKQAAAAAEAEPLLLPGADPVV